MVADRRRAWGVRGAMEVTPVVEAGVGGVVIMGDIRDFEET